MAAQVSVLRRFDKDRSNKQALCHQRPPLGGKVGGNKFPGTKLA